jgi:hypothetical protein|tara:strand:- start:463 stop:1080 length:618 start_codon:yes stop_codon:yes gene_type:complete
MKVSRLLDYLRFGELSDLAVSDISVQANLDKLFTYINRGLKKVNSELSILEEEAAFTITTGVYTYEITDPLILRVTAVYDQAGVELPLDVEGDPRSVFTSSYNKVSFVGHRDDTDNKVTTLSVIYLKDFTEITAVTDEISISDGIMEVLTNYVAYLAHGSVNMSEGGAASKYQTQYEVELGKARKFGYKAQMFNSVDKLRERGFA